MGKSGKNERQTKNAGSERSLEGGFVAGGQARRCVVITGVAIGALVLR